MTLRLLSVSLLVAAGTSSCGLIKVPFRVAGAVVEGTADVGKAGYNASKKAFGKSEEEKAEEKKEKEAKAKREAEEEKAKRAAEINRHTEGTHQLQEPRVSPTLPDDSLPPLPPVNEPLPSDAPLPYQEP